MIRICFTISFILTFSLTFGQENKYYNEFFYPVKFQKKSPPAYYSESEVIEKFKIEKFYSFEDSLLLRVKKIEKDREGKEINEIISYYDSNGKLTQDLHFNKETNYRILRKFDENGNITRQRDFLKSKSVNDIYFDESGLEIEKKSELHPEPYKGFSAWNKYMVQNIKYPKEARSGQVKADILVYFTVSELGKIADIEILNPDEVNFSFAEVAYNLVKNYPHDWNPYILNGEILKKEVILPIIFNAMTFR